MKKHNPFKKQNAMVAFALAVASLNAAEQRDGAQKAHQDPTVPLEAQESDTRRLTKEEAIEQLSHGMEDEYEKECLMGVLEYIVPPDHYTKDFIITVNKLSQGMEYENKENVIRTLVKISPNHYTEAFISTVNKLSEDMKDYNKSTVIFALKKISPAYYSAFIETVNQLSQGMDPDDKAFFVTALEKINPDHFTERFSYTVNQLSHGMDRFTKTRAIEFLKDVNPAYYSDFITTFNQISEGMDSDKKLFVIRDLTETSPNNYSAFIDIVNQLSQGMDSYRKAIVIRGLKDVSLDHYSAFVKTVNQLLEGMDPDRKAFVIEVLGTISPDRYTEAFSKTVNQLLQGMDGYDKYGVIKVLGTVSPACYTEAFSKTVNQLSQGMNNYDKIKIIMILRHLSPDCYTEAFSKTVNQLSQGMDYKSKVIIILTLGDVSRDYKTEAFIKIVNQLFYTEKTTFLEGQSNFMLSLGYVSPACYTEEFVNTVNQLSEGMDLHNKTKIIKALGKISPELYPFLQNFIRQNSNYFNYVPANALNHSITPNMNQQELQDLLQRLHREYHNQAPAGTPQGIAFGIHNFSNQKVVGENEEKQTFNTAVLAHVKKSIKGRILNYDTVLQILTTELQELMKDPLKSNAINQDVYNWVIQNNEYPEHKDAIASVVTYLEQQDDTHAKTSTWLYVFMDESNNAYNSGNRESCIKGVKERVITSLRSAAPEGDKALESLFNQGETSLMLATKSKSLTDYAFWAKQLLEKGVRSTTTQTEAKAKFTKALDEYFDGIKKDERLKATIDAIAKFI